MRPIKFKWWDFVSKNMTTALEMPKGDWPYLMLSWKHKYCGLESTWLINNQWCEIFEGDIITWDEYGQKHIIEMKQWAFRITQNEYDFNDDVLGNLNYKECKILWNIYEHPELLNK